MTGEVIKSFLVGLGFSVDDKSLKQFNDAIKSATLRVAALFSAVDLSASGIVYGISKISESFEQMGYDFRIIAPMINKTIVLRNEMLKAYSLAGINITKVVLASYKLNMSFAKTKFALEAIYKSVGSRFFELLTKQSDIFRKKLYDNMPKIQAALEKFVGFIFKAFDATVRLGERAWSILSRVYDFFVRLDKATSGWSTVLLGVLAAWELLNLAFLSTPLGQLITGLVAIVALFDDFKTWQEGGQSFFDWAPFVPVINAVKDVLSSLYDVWDSIFKVIGNIGVAIYQLFKGDFDGALDSMKEAGREVLNYWTKLFGAVNNVWGIIKAVGTWGAGIFPGNPSNTSANLQNNPVGRPLANPVGSQVSNSQTNQHVQQQTQIHVSGSADANATGRAVASQQGRVNSDMVRNMKGATR